MLRWKSCFVHLNNFLQIMNKINRKHLFFHFGNFLLRSCALILFSVSLFCKVNPLVLQFQGNKSVIFPKKHPCFNVFKNLRMC